MTTTPFEFEDVTPILMKPEEQVETAWQILRPQFGTQLIFGCDRIVLAPNFFDVIAMGVLIEFLIGPQDLKDLIKASTSIANEIAVRIDQLETTSPFDEFQQIAVKDCLISPIDEKTFPASVRIDAQKCEEISSVILSIFERLKCGLERNIEVVPENRTVG